MDKDCNNSSSIHPEVEFDEQFYNRIWDVDDVAQYLGCSKGHVYNLVSRRELPFRKIGRLLRFLPQEIQEWIMEA